MNYEALVMPDAEEASRSYPYLYEARRMLLGVVVGDNYANAKAVTACDKISAVPAAQSPTPHYKAGTSPTISGAGVRPASPMIVHNAWHDQLAKRAFLLAGTVEASSLSITLNTSAAGLGLPRKNP